jgi:hypothetical protein
MTVFAGTFSPPVIGASQVPIKIAGSGYCELIPEGLKIQGFKQKSKFSSGQVILFCVSILFGIYIIVQGLLKIQIPQWLQGSLISAIIAMFLYPFMTGQGNDHQGESIELLIPWENIPRASLEGGLGLVVIHIKKFRHQQDRYQGGLYFIPSDEPSNLLNALKSHKVKC